MGNRRDPGENERRSSDVSDVVELGETSSGEEQIRPTQNRLSQHSSPEPRNRRDKSAQSRVSFDIEPAKEYVPPRTPRKRRLPSNEESDESDASDSDGRRPMESRKCANKENARPKLESQPSFIQTSEIFGTEAPIPLFRDPVVHSSDIRRDDMDAMGESIADAMGKEVKIGKFPDRRMNSFIIDAVRGFCEYRIPIESGVDGGILADTLRRIAISQRRDLYRYGFRFFLTASARKAIAMANFGPYAHAFEKGDFLLLGDFRGQSIDQLEVYRPLM